MAAFHLIIYGRFWVITEAMGGLTSIPDLLSGRPESLIPPSEFLLVHALHSALIGLPDRSEPGFVFFRS
jgi:hypothetical protein